jgi:mutator protein MutT
MKRGTAHGELRNIASGLIFDQEGRLLLLMRHPDDSGGGMWGFPGGSIDPGEEAADTVRREVQEETGIELAEWREVGMHEVHMPHGSVYLRSFASNVAGTPEVRLQQEEHIDYRWFDLAELRQTTQLLWGIPTILNDLGFLRELGADATLSDGSTASLIRQD